MIRLPTASRLATARSLVYGAVAPTPQYPWPLLARRLGTRVWVKHENHTATGAFKLRGGLVYFDALKHGRLTGGVAPAGVITATRGNHGQSIGFAAREAGIPAVVVVPHGNSREKNAAMRALGVELVEHGEDFQAASEHAAQLATERNLHRVPSFHPDLIAGVASYWLEFFEAVPELERVYVPIGMGSGAAAAVAARGALRRRMQIIGVTSSLAPAFAQSIAAGRAVEAPVTTLLADGMACRTPDPDALAVLASALDEVVQVDDDEVAHAMKALFVDTHNVAEGAGAAALAAALQQRGQLAGKVVGLSLSGGNVDHDLFARVLSSTPLEALQ